MEIVQDHNPSREKLNALGVFSWPIWEKEKSDFPYCYETAETCFIIEGHFIVTPDGGEPVDVRPGDLVTFPAGLSCRWKILRKVRKHYRFA
ncbi:MAG TPA: cupin domain-containing protein [Anaerolineales bacterium]|nr:cupin domain-containing protein [Anaerolineales bacterium]